MPIYEYECIGCQSKFELRRSFGENPGVSCPMCQSEAHRIFSPVPIIFKGSGFYVTDNRKNHNNLEDKSNLDQVEAGKQPEGD